MDVQTIVNDVKGRVEPIVADVKGRVEPIVADVKGRVEPIVAKGQNVVTASVDTFKKATPVVVEGVQSLVKTQIGAGKDLLDVFQGSFDKAIAAGIKAVATSPIEYIPDGRQCLISAYNDTVSLMTKTGDELVKIVKEGFDTVSATLKGTAAKAEVEAEDETEVEAGDDATAEAKPARKTVKKAKKAV